MNQYRFPWRRAAALAATALLAQQLAVAYRARPQVERRAARRSLHSAWHQVRHCRVFSRYGAPAFTSSNVPIVLVHGFGVSCDYFVPLAERLAADHPVYAPDLPGHGRSDTPVHPLDIPDLAQTLLDWMNNAGIGKAFLVGQSMGAQIAIEAVRWQPQRFAGLALIGPTRDPHAGKVSHVWRLLRVAPFERLSLFGILVQDYLRMGWRLLPECRAMMRDPVAAKSKQLALPVMLIKGEYDAIVPADWFAYLKQATRACQVVIVRGGGHAVNHSAPDEVANAVRTFLRQIERSPEKNREREEW
jgi:pimeloyl-ACP methyl ester carboxylesterase